VCASGGLFRFGPVQAAVDCLMQLAAYIYFIYICVEVDYGDFACACALRVGLKKGETGAVAYQRCRGLQQDDVCLRLNGLQLLEGDRMRQRRRARWAVMR
jgi:hypothetical protein